MYCSLLVLLSIVAICSSQYVHTVYYESMNGTCESPLFGTVYKVGECFDTGTRFFCLDDGTYITQRFETSNCTGPATNYTVDWETQGCASGNGNTYDGRNFCGPLEDHPVSGIVSTLYKDENCT